MTDASHAGRTPGPWHKSRKAVYISDFRNCVVAEIVEPDREANAQFIVTACNSYDALVAENERLREALIKAADDFRIIQTLNSHGASDQTYIGWLRSNARQGEANARAALTASPVTSAEAREPTEAQVNSACMSFRHDFGLLDKDQKASCRFDAREWLYAWQKEGFQPLAANLVAPTPQGAMSAPADERCEYCSDGKITGLPNNACENCMNTGLKHPDKDGEDGTARLCEALYGRKAVAGDYLGGSDARMLHDAADRLALNAEITNAASRAKSRSPSAISPRSRSHDPC